MVAVRARRCGTVWHTTAGSRDTVADLPTTRQWQTMALVAVTRNNTSFGKKNRLRVID